MENGTPGGETAAPKAPENGTQTPAPVSGNAGGGTKVEVDAEELKNLRQAEMRARQLQREKEQREKAEADRAARELEEQNQFKELHEQERAKREALERQIEDEQRKKELDKARAEVLKPYTDEVKAEAEALGITLSSTDEADIAAYKEKLERIQKRSNAGGRVTPNNPNTNAAELPNDELLKRVRYGDRNARTQAISNLAAVKAMKQMAGYSDNS